MEAQKINSIILRGNKASGKTYTSEIIAGLFQEKKVLRIDTCSMTLVGIARKIKESDYDLIIFDECFNAEFISEINQLVVLKYMYDNEKKVKNILFLTQDFDFKELEGFKIIECTYEAKPANFLDKK